MSTDHLGSNRSKGVQIGFKPMSTLLQGTISAALFCPPHVYKWICICACMHMCMYMCTYVYVCMYDKRTFPVDPKTD